MTGYYNVIHNSDLAAYLRSQKQFSLAGRLDPAGVSVVELSMLHNDEEIRAIMMLKLSGSDEPVEAKIDFPFSTYRQITQRLILDESKTPH